MRRPSFLYLTRRRIFLYHPDVSTVWSVRGGARRLVRSTWPSRYMRKSPFFHLERTDFLFLPAIARPFKPKLPKAESLAFFHLSRRPNTMSRIQCNNHSKTSPIPTIAIDGEFSEDDKPILLLKLNLRDTDRLITYRATVEVDMFLDHLMVTSLRQSNSLELPDLHLKKH